MGHQRQVVTNNSSGGRAEMLGRVLEAAACVLYPHSGGVVDVSVHANGWRFSATAAKPSIEVLKKLGHDVCPTEHPAASYLVFHGLRAWQDRWRLLYPREAEVVRAWLSEETGLQFGGFYERGLTYLCTVLQRTKYVGPAGKVKPCPDWVYTAFFKLASKITETNLLANPNIIPGPEPSLRFMVPWVGALMKVSSAQRRRAMKDADSHCKSKSLKAEKQGRTLNTPETRFVPKVTSRLRYQLFLDWCTAFVKARTAQERRSTVLDKFRAPKVEELSQSANWVDDYDKAAEEAGMCLESAYSDDNFRELRPRLSVTGVLQQVGSFLRR